MTRTPRRNIVPIPRAAVLGPMLVRIRELAATSEKVFFSPHARSQMAKRGLTDLEVLRVLKLGQISGVPWHEPRIPGRACKVVFKPRGSRSIGVVTVILDIEELLLKTVGWEDER
jgi:hypothetical protein